MKTNKMKASQPTLQPATADFQNLIDLLAVFTEASNRLDALQATANEDLAAILDEIKEEYAQAQEAATKAESAIEQIALKNPDWFTDKRTLRTPYGTVSLRRGSKLDAPNEEASLVRIRLFAEKHFPGAGPDETRAREEFISRFIRTKETLNLEALEAESDTFLTTIGVARVPFETFSAKPATLDLGKAVKEAAEVQTATTNQ